MKCPFCEKEMITAPDDDKIQFYNECHNHKIGVQVWHEKGEWFVLAAKGIKPSFWRHPFLWFKFRRFKKELLELVDGIIVKRDND